MLPAAYAPLGEATLLDARNFGGGSTPIKKAGILWRHSVAALLNTAHPGVSYEVGNPQDVISGVSAALATEDPVVMLALKDILDGWNNAGCPLN